MTPFLFLAVRWPTLLRRWFRSEAGVHFRQDVKNLQRFRKTIHRFVGAPAVHRKQDESLAVMDNHRETFDLCRKSCGLKMKASILRWTERHSAPPVFPHSSSSKLFKFLSLQLSFVFSFFTCLTATSGKVINDAAVKDFKCLNTFKLKCGFFKTIYGKVFMVTRYSILF